MNLLYISEAMVTKVLKLLILFYLVLHILKKMVYL